MSFNKIPWRPILAWLAAAIIIAVSVFLFYRKDFPSVEAVFFFPADDTVYELKGERRKVPFKDDDEEFAVLLVEEISLGPGNIHLYPLVSRKAEIRSVYLRGKTLFIDYSLEILEPAGLATAPVEVIAAGIKKTLFHNLPWLDEVVITINGEQLLEDSTTVKEIL